MNSVKKQNIFNRFFLYLSGTDPVEIRNVPILELYIQVILGIQIFITSILALISCTYAMILVFDNLFYSIIIGVIWAFVILNTDRLIISTFHKTSQISIREGQILLNFISYLIKFCIRFFLACFVSLIISIPLELKIFESEIDIYFLKKSKSEFFSNKDTINFFINKELVNNDELVFLKEIRDNLRERINITPVYLYRREFVRIDSNRYNENTVNVRNPEFTVLTNQLSYNEQKLRELESNYSNLKDSLFEQYNDFNKRILDEINSRESKSLVTRIITLMKLKDTTDDKSNSKNISFFIFWAFPLIFLFIEILPVFLKWLSGESQYTSILKMKDRLAIKKNNEKE